MPRKKDKFQLAAESIVFNNGPFRRALIEQEGDDALADALADELRLLCRPDGMLGREAPK